MTGVQTCALPIFGELRERGPLRALWAALNNGLGPGRVGVVAGPSGAGKTTVAVRIATDRALRGGRVLHVGPPGARDVYDSVLSASLPKVVERLTAQLMVERAVSVHPARSAVGPGSLAGLLAALEAAIGVHPDTVLVDGNVASEAVGAWRTVAQELGLAVWLTSTGEVAGSHADVVLELVPEAGGVLLYGRHGLVLTPIRLEHGGVEPVSTGVQDAEVTDPEAVLSPEPARCTLYSGGAHGAEAAFGAAAERWGIAEVNYTFKGHVQARTRGAHPLTEAELAQGDISLAYVGRRLRRNFSESGTMHRVLQSLWHQVQSSSTVFVVGTIQENGTVTGGTGWSVELARMWNKRTWVFDQDRDGWYRWDGASWIPGEARVVSPTFCGTGTRYLAPNGQRAIDELFLRSFLDRAGPSGPGGAAA